MAKQSQRVADVMKRDLVVVAPDTSMADAATRMRDNDIGDVLVADADRLRGIITDRDLVIRGVADRRSPDDPISELCSTEDLARVAEDDDLEYAVGLMRRRSVRRLPVVDADERPIGIVSLGDLAMQQDPSSALADISAAPPTS
jgi:CBS domain-containing protein